MSRHGIRAKLILIFVAIKVVPLFVLAAFAWTGQTWLAERVSENIVHMAESMRGTVEIVADSTTDAAIKALDTAARESLERLTTDTARAIAAFLHDRDRDVLSAALLEPTEDNYRRFLAARTKAVERGHPWRLAPDGGGWVPEPDSAPRDDRSDVRSTNEDNRRNFHYRHPDVDAAIEQRPLFLEMSFVGLDGCERVKVTTSPLMTPALRDVSDRRNTFVKAEAYFAELRTLKPGEVHVSDVIGAYVPSPIIGPYTPEAARARGLGFEPEQAAFAGNENPVGKRFQGLVRWATPVERNGAITGWITLALDHTHIMEFTDHIRPTVDRYSSIPDAASGNYAFLWDYAGRSIAHPRHHSIVGYDPTTGEPAVPWLEAGLYQSWRESGQPIRTFLEQTPAFHQQTLRKKGAPELVKEGSIGLDCRYLNHAPQCAGWMDLTQHGGSGSFEIYWSGLWKLTTAAAIPYHTGPYGRSPRGFGFVTIGANVDDFHRAATDSKRRAAELVAQRERELQAYLDDAVAQIAFHVTTMARQLSGSTAVMTVLVIGVAVWMASFLTRRITSMVEGIHRFRNGDLSHRLPVHGRDEMASLEQSFNHMADRVQESVVRLRDAKHKAEEASRMKSEFLASMSHELRTPLNGIIGFAELLRDEAWNDEARENAVVIETSSRHLLELVNSILDIAKIEAGAMVLRIEPVNLRVVLAEVASVHQAVAAGKGVGFAVDLAEGAPDSVPADITRLRQVLHNLLSNAVKFTQAGEIRLSATREGAVMIVRVQDTGPGIPEDLQEAVFEKFRQGDAFLTRAHGGTGLGLTLARHLVELMGGRIGVTSSAGHGATFHFTLPIKPAGRPAPASPVV
ncbi:ATP-binding protein [Azospirillum doebereinerae]|uniref:HAMP domain-containing sensor histidine kinase n=1 Tax=Azospirillum doebereinerae TaxID=92933 RepID=UPI001EE506CA|nr:HAMP domain-containing sensor histidine kinase [Azospirillum doebereinerae]MCG5244023.1 HAMP domain-containing histidine kinase [Azospirillum doebereinerae]